MAAASAASLGFASGCLAVRTRLKAPADKNLASGSAFKSGFGFDALQSFNVSKKSCLTLISSIKSNLPHKKSDSEKHQKTYFPAASLSCIQKKVSVVIFDLDGTLLDTENSTMNVMRDFLAKYGKHLEDREDMCLGITQKESAENMVEYFSLPMTPAEFIAQTNPLFKQAWANPRVLPGVDRLLGHLQKHGVPFAPASNSYKAIIEGKISHLQGWTEKFDVILGSDEVESGKPSPVLFQEAAKRMGVSDPTRCLVMEDSGVGVQAARAAGMNVVAVPSRSELKKVSIADTILHTLLEFKPEVWGLPPFEDCM